MKTRTDAWCAKMGDYGTGRLLVSMAQESPDHRSTVDHRTDHQPGSPLLTVLNIGLAEQRMCVAAAVFQEAALGPHPISLVQDGWVHHT